MLSKFEGVKEGIAKLLSASRKQPDRSLSGDHLAGIVVPKAERICPCMTIGVGGETIAAGLEVGADLIMSGKKPLRLPGRLELPHDFLSPPHRPVATLDPVVEAFVGPVIGTWGLTKNRFD